MVDEDGSSRQKSVPVAVVGTAETGPAEDDTYYKKERRITDEPRENRPLTIGTDPVNDRAQEDFQIEELNGPLTFANSKRQFRSIEEVFEGS